MTPSNTSIRLHLEMIVEKEPQTLRAAVAREALKHDNPAVFFSDLLNHGCVSGLVSSLIYYTDTHAFFDKYYEEIEDLRCECEEETGVQISIQHDLKNFLAWFAFEETVYRLAIKLELENEL